MLVFTIVVTYNGAQWLDKCFGSLRDSKLEGEHHIIAIDNGSSDNTVALIEQHYPEVELIVTGENLGFGAANNIGIKKALKTNADFIFLLNQDAWVEDDTILGMIEVAKKNPEYGVLSPVQYHPGGGVEKQFTNYLNKSNNIIHGDIIETLFVNAAVWLLPTEAVKQVGLFDSIFFHYGEDDNYCNRMHFWGYKVGICDRYKAYHDRVFSAKNVHFRVRSGALNLLLNINESLSTAILKFYISTPKRLLTMLYRKRFLAFGMWIKMCFRVPFLLKDVKSTRKRTKNVYNA